MAARSDADWRRWFDSVTPFVVEDGDGRPVGICGGTRNPERRATAVLISMWVDPVARGTGAGDALIAAALAWAAGQACHRLELTVLEANAAARRLYERNGFRPTGRSVRAGA